ncbi:alpha/beta hydrolase [Mucilaginibacter sp. 14171R-50]|uniref:alpha/beta fold hydrolase n=1 Tax=Mucilaginibacter sp. 14171R-50 TaxID=2703789 RepID=UPI00138C41F2|nr:alpha/beta hydrolase [Mucilaginibacter sp. 14171R-50]QHS54438.1 alpha/beta hydrolase [Mucilaginibacter sp. 14171R-50]
MGFLNISGLGKVHYHEYGSGGKPLLAFHGYGMTGRQFHVLENSILREYHVYGFDHFFHGGSQLGDWTEAQILTGMPREMVKQYAEEWFKLHGRQRFSVLGYSIGANIALLLVEEYPGLIDEVILMAPDGLAVYKGFEILLHKPWGRYMFKTVTKSKWLAPAVLNSLKKIRFIDDSLHQIAYNEIDTEQKRQDVYYTLNLIRLVKPDTQKIATLINQHHIKCRLIFGKYDNLFPMKAARSFIDKVQNADVHEVNMGHWLVTRQLDEYLVNLQQ